MTPANTVINGNALITDGNDAIAALNRFYAAFNGADVTAMADNWWHDEQVSMSNPLGGIRRGWPAIQGGYETLFHGAATVYVEFYDFSIHQAADMFCAVGRERGWFRHGGQELALAIRTTRIYRLNNEGEWRQWHHHGSIDSPSLLAEYQAAFALNTQSPLTGSNS